ncbi:hypothetical protein Hanom_Chr12g01172231 [Helianthus anomalus]
MSFSSLRFSQFCDFYPNVCFSASVFKRFESLLFSPGLLTSSIFFSLNLGYFCILVNLMGNSFFSRKTEYP